MDLQELPGAQGVPRAGGGFTWALEHVLAGAGRVEGAQAGTSLGAENEVVVIARPRDEVVEDGREADLGEVDVEGATAEGVQAGSTLGADDVEVEIIVRPNDMAVEEGRDRIIGADLSNVEVEMIARPRHSR